MKRKEATDVSSVYKFFEATDNFKFQKLIMWWMAMDFEKVIDQTASGFPE